MNVEKILNEIVEEKGIKEIREFLKKYNKKERKKQFKINNYLDVAIDVYNLMMWDDYSKTRAYDEISSIRNIT